MSLVNGKSAYEWIEKHKPQNGWFRVYYEDSLEHETATTTPGKQLRWEWKYKDGKRVSAVTISGVRKTYPLKYEQIKRAMQQGSSSVNQYTAASYVGNFPIGSLTADVLKCVRKRTALNQAQMAIDDKNQAMADVGISSDDLDLYKRQKQGTLTPVTLYRGEEAVPVLMKTDDRGSFVNYTDLKGNE